jgi:hypothetical protein
MRAMAGIGYCILKYFVLNGLETRCPLNKTGWKPVLLLPQPATLWFKRTTLF